MKLWSGSLNDGDKFRFYHNLAAYPSETITSDYIRFNRSNHEKKHSLISRKGLTKQKFRAKLFRVQEDIVQRMHARKRDKRFLTWYRLLRVVKKGVGAISPPFVQAGLSRPQFDLLGAIAMDEGQTQQIYAERMTVTKGNITQMLDKLEMQGLVLRRKEGRTNCLHLTDAGWQVIGQVTPDHDALLYQVFAQLSADDLTQLAKILRKFERSMG